MLLWETFILLAGFAIYTLHGAQIYQYDVPIVTIRVGSAWVIDGSFNLVHVIHLQDYAKIAEEISSLVETRMPPTQNKHMIDYQLTEIKNMLQELGYTSKQKRSIDWIGSAWKWIAGNPDATDWNSVLSSQDAIIRNNNEQYKVNENILNSTRDVIRKTNELVDSINQISSGRKNDLIGQNTLNQIVVLKDVLKEIIRACQLAKNGIINTNLLDKREVDSIINEMETLPYANAVEAIEYGTPTIYANGSVLLYVLSMPKLRKDLYHQLIIRTPITNGKQIELPYDEVLINEAETYGIRIPCLQINNATVCRQSSLKQLPEDACIPRLLKSKNASCRYKLTNDHAIEMITTDILFLTNYEGTIKLQEHTKTLNGTYLIRLNNESITIGGRTFSSTLSSRLQPLPSVLMNITSESFVLDVDHVHSIGLRNIEKLQYLGSKLDISLGTYIMILILAGISIGILWYKITKKLNLPTVQLPPTMNPPTHVICGTQIFKEGGVKNIVNAADQL